MTALNGRSNGTVMDGPREPGTAYSLDPAISTANANAEVFTPEQIEMLAFRRFNPLVGLTAATLTSALDGYLGGYLPQAARLWDRLSKQQKTIRNVKAKREEAVALRGWTIERTDDSPEAHDQKAVLEHFYGNARAGHALNRNISGGPSKIFMQMMEAKSFGSAAHHLIWNPDSSRQVKLPSGKAVPSLTAKFEYVPMEFFESRTGELRFLGMTQGFTGIPLDPMAWLVTSEESPLMFAASVLAYYDKLATADLINFSEKFGTPGLVVHTTAARGTPEGDSAVALTKSLGSNYRGTQFGAAENKVEIIWPSGGTSGSELPMHTIIEDVKRDLASLFLGADLSTQSRGTESVGASVQQEGEERRERADCAWISETLNAGVDPIVLRWYFGDAPVLAKVTIDAPKNEDRTILANLTQQAVAMGAQVPIEPVMKRLNVPLAKDGEKDVFTAPAATTEIPDGSTLATNAAGTGSQDGRTTACGAGFQPALRGAVRAALATGGDAEFLSKAREVYELLATNIDDRHDRFGRFDFKFSADTGGGSAGGSSVREVASLKDFFFKLKSDPAAKIEAPIGVITGQQARRVSRALGHEVKEIWVNADHFRHVARLHPEITEADWHNLPETISTADRIRPSKTERGEPAVEIWKKDESWKLVIGTGRRGTARLYVRTFKRKGEMP